MRISKYVHSCVVLEERGERLLFDPGKFSFNEGRVRPEDFGSVTTVVLTHSHPDHVDREALKRIVELSGASVVTNGEVARSLAEDGVRATILDEGVATVGAFTLRAVSATHEPILADGVPQNTAYIVNDAVLNPGDSFNPALTALAGTATLLLPVMAPWLTEVAALRFAETLRPRLVIPVHDGYARDFFLRLRYDVYEPYLARSGVRFARLLAPGDAVDAP